MRYILFLILIFAVSCSDNNPLLSRLDHIDSIMDANPQAAYDSLCTIKKTQNITSAKKVDMKWRLLMATAQNKLYMQMPTDSAFSEVVAYYDRNGSDNEKMQSRYLLGCIYRDMNDAPEAIEWYTDAAEQADTMSNDCDYKTLFRIYGQMADIYDSQYLPDESIDAYLKYSNYAQKAGDIYNYIRGKEFVGSEAYTLGDTTKALNIFKECIRLYNKYGLKKEAASAYPIIIKAYIYRGQYDSAHIYMDI